MDAGWMGLIGALGGAALGAVISLGASFIADKRAAKRDAAAAA